MVFRQEGAQNVKLGSWFSVVNFTSFHGQSSCVRDNRWCCYEQRQEPSVAEG